MSIHKFLIKSVPLAVVFLLMPVAGANLGLAAPQPVEIVMQGTEFKVTSGGHKGNNRPGFSLSVGEVTEVVLKNEDNQKHHFVSPLFKKTDVTILGEAKEINAKGILGYSVEPGKKVTIQFKPAIQENFEGGYDVFYCDIHGKMSMRGEVLIVDTRTGEGAF